MFQHFRLAYCQFVFSIRERMGTFPEVKASILWEDDFRETIKAQSCRIARSNCEGCPLLHNCTYALHYEVDHLQEKKIYQLFPVVPPFAWSFPAEKKTSYLAKEKLVFGLTLFGSGIEHLPVFFRSLQHYFESSSKGSRMGAVLQEARLENPFSGRSFPIFSRGEEEPSGDLKEGIITGKQIEKWSAEQPHAERFSLRFQTPLLLTLEGEKLVRPIFQVIIRELFRRVSLLYYQFHGYKELDINYSKYMEDASKIEIVRDQTRFASWEQFPRRLFKHEGITGGAQYRGPFGAFIPLLKLAEYTNLGSGSTFGLGRFTFKIIHLQVF